MKILFALTIIIAAGMQIDGRTREAVGVVFLNILVVILLFFLKTKKNLLNRMPDIKAFLLKALEDQEQEHQEGRHKHFKKALEAQYKMIKAHKLALLDAKIEEVILIRNYQLMNLDSKLFWENRIARLEKERGALDD